MSCARGPVPQLDGWAEGNLGKAEEVEQRLLRGSADELGCGEPTRGEEGLDEAGGDEAVDGGERRQSKVAIMGFSVGAAWGKWKRGVRWRGGAEEMS